MRCVVNAASLRLFACVLFVPLWAVMNYAFGAALDGPIGITPCERGSSCEQLERCSVKDPLMAVRAKMVRILGDTSIYELAG